MKIIHETNYGAWYMDDTASIADTIFINYVSADCTQLASFAIIEGVVHENAEKRIGRARNVPQVVIEKAQ